VVCARRHNNSVTVTDKMFLLVIEDEFGIALLDTEELVDLGMYFVPISSLGCKHITTS